jgi:hypothetical protein
MAPDRPRKRSGSVVGCCHQAKNSSGENVVGTVAGRRTTAAEIAHLENRLPPPARTFSDAGEASLAARAPLRGDVRTANFWVSGVPIRRVRLIAHLETS